MGLLIASTATCRRVTFAVESSWEWDRPVAFIPEMLNRVPASLAIGKFVTVRFRSRFQAH